MEKTLESLINVGIPYQQKIYFDKFYKYDTFDNNAYMTVVSKKMPTEEEFDKYILPELNDRNIYVTYTKNRFIDYNIYEHNKIIYTTKQIQQFHSKFNKYIYFHKGYIDPHPRLFHECCFYNKEFVYINLQNIKDGGYYRYRDVLNNQLKNISMTKEDLLINDVYDEPRKYNIDVAVVHAFLPFINGGLYDAIEYFLALYDFKPKDYNVKLYFLHNRHDWCNTNSEFILNQIRDKYDLTDDYYQNIHFIKDSVDLVKKEYRPTNIVIIDNHTFSCLSRSTQAIVKKFFLTIDPFFPSMTNYEELDKEKKFNIYNEIKLWVDDK